jgi:hypothetical protein
VEIKLKYEIVSLSTNVNRCEVRKYIEQVGLAAMLSTSVWNVSGWNLGYPHWFTPVSPGKRRNNALTSHTAVSFHVHSNSSFINHPIIRSYTVSLFTASLNNKQGVKKETSFALDTGNI